MLHICGVGTWNPTPPPPPPPPHGGVPGYKDAGDMNDIMCTGDSQCCQEGSPHDPKKAEDRAERMSLKTGDINATLGPNHPVALKGAD